VGACQALGIADAELASVSVGSLLRKLRRQKDPDEIALLEQCMRATEAGHVWARENVGAGISELDVYCGVQSAALAAAGRVGLLYGDFRATSPSVPKVGGLPTSHVLQDGEIFTLDYSVVLEGYRSDFTNAIAVGTPSAKQREIFSVCQAAMRSGESVLKAGVLARDVFAATSKPMEESGYGKLGHHAGHGIGLAHPEPPILVPQSDDVLEAGDVLTLEPGLYVEGIGGLRIEHNYLITDEGYRRLSQHTISLE
jgi:Xaa-Pro aminopeptidase